MQTIVPGKPLQTSWGNLIRPQALPFRGRSGQMHFQHLGFPMGTSKDPSLRVYRALYLVPPQVVDGMNFLWSIEEERAASEWFDSSSKDVERLPSNSFSLLVFQLLLSGFTEVFLHVRCIPHQNSQRWFWASVCVCGVKLWLLVLLWKVPRSCTQERHGYFWNTQLWDWGAL